MRCIHTDDPATLMTFLKLRQRARWLVSGRAEQPSHPIPLNPLHCKNHLKYLLTFKVGKQKTNCQIGYASKRQHVERGHDRNLPLFAQHKARDLFFFHQYVFCSFRSDCCGTRCFGVTRQSLCILFLFIPSLFCCNAATNSETRKSWSLRVALPVLRSFSFYFNHQVEKRLELVNCPWYSLIRISVLKT